MVSIVIRNKNQESNLLLMRISMPQRPQMNWMSR